MNPFIEYDVTDDPVKSEEMIHRSKRHTVPEIFINNSFIGGCFELFDLDENGDLDQLLEIIAPGRLEEQ